MQKEYIERTKHYLANIEALEPIATGSSLKISKDNSIKALVFDIYGTLIISASGDLDKANASIDNLNEAIAEGGFMWNPEHQFEYSANQLLSLFHKTVINHQDALKAQGHPYPEVDIIKVWNECLDKGIEYKWISEIMPRNTKLLTVVFELLSNQVYPMPNMNACLSKLFNNSIPKGIVSNAQFYTPLLMNNFIHNEISEKEHVQGFDEDISLYSYKLLRSKPDVSLFEKLAKSFKEKYNLEPEQIAFVGNDMLKDVWTASQAGFKTILFAADQRSLKLRKEDERCKNLKPDYIIDDLMQIFEIVSISKTDK